MGETLKGYINGVKAELDIRNVRVIQQMEVKNDFINSRGSCIGVLEDEPLMKLSLTK